MLTIFEFGLLEMMQVELVLADEEDRSGIELAPSVFLIFLGWMVHDQLCASR